jgi:hypothetical protein
MHTLCTQIAESMCLAGLPLPVTLLTNRREIACSGLSTHPAADQQPAV